jgi:hypothetical protein
VVVFRGTSFGCWAPAISNPEIQTITPSTAATIMGRIY